MLAFAQRLQTQWRGPGRCDKLRGLSMKTEPVIYFDNNATTAVDPAVVTEMLPFLTELYGNPSSAYTFGSQVAKAVETARERVAALLGCEPREIIFTSCGTESNNAAITSALSLDRDRQHIVTTRVEHSAIIKHCEWLAKRGHEVTWLGVDERGQIDLGELERAIRPDTAIVSTMWANNETGVLFPIEEIAAIVHKKKTLFHTDAVQAVGKIPINLGHSHINFLSVSGHKLHCPKGVGVLFVSRRTRFNPYLIGGGQEHGKRAGTENVASIVALGKAAELAGETMEHENTFVRGLRDDFEKAVLEKIADTQLNGDAVHRLPNTTSIAFDGIESEGVLMLLDKAGICCSAGSACTTGSIHPSHVLRAMGFSAERARSSLRFSFSRFNTKDEVEKAIEILPRVIAKLRQMTLAA
ncbi:MAG: cysteine desulfurase [Chthoniobacter sp.]|jgi:cysteine desulfurase|nr:cysteine desulfurase [Chthoniobacter sp.]